MRLLVLILILLSAVKTTAAQEPGERLQNANEIYRAGKFEEAARHYEAILDEGYRSEALHYNLGNAYYRSGRLGKAILHYERALILDPGDEDILHNLDVARRQLTDDLDPVSEFFLRDWWHAMRMWLPSGAWSALAITLLWLGLGGLTLWLIGKTRKQKKVGFIAGVSLLSICILPFMLASSRSAFEADSMQAVILAKETTLHSAPDSVSQEILRIHEGLKVRLLDAIGDWKKVRLPNGEVGWLPDEAMEEI
jgi:tetratricopeptide (TPR) repeat protein